MSGISEPIRSAIENAEEVLAGLKEQISLLGNLKQLAVAQGPLIASREHDSLMALIQRRQGVLDCLEATRDRMSPLLVKVQNQSKELSEPVRAVLRATLAEVRELVAEIAAIDCADSEVLQSSHARCKDELETMAQAGRAQSGYREEFQPPARFADATG